MKPYFTKYIPVEGEIKVGDFYLRDNLINQRLMEEEWKTYPKEWKKVKLFLCSRDINWDKDLHDLNTMIYAPFDGEDTNPYKAIGEVSPNAIWVKEGMEFEEGDIQFFYNGISLPTDPIKFKCPTCNTFH